MNHESSDDVLRYRALIDSMNDGLGVIDENNVFTYVNQKFADMLEYSPDEMIGEKLSKFLDEKNKKILEENVEKRTKGLRSQYELEWSKKSGDLIPTIVSGTPLIDDGGKHRGSFAVITDITDRISMEQALVESEERYRSLVEAAPFSIVLTDMEGEILMVNRRAIEMYGCTSINDMIGMSALDLISPEQRELALENMKKTLEKGMVKGMEYNLFRVDGTTYPAEMSASVIYDSSGRPIAFSGIIRDITERKERERNLRESEERYRLLFEKCYGSST